MTQFSIASLVGAAELATASSYKQRQMNFKVGPERFSFARMKRDNGEGDASCRAAFRFHLRDLERLFHKMRLPIQIDTGMERVDDEEAFLLMLKRLAYPMTFAQLAWPAGRSPYSLSRCLLLNHCGLRRPARHLQIS